MKSLVVYYSLEGNTKFVANTIAEEIGADIVELKPKKEISSTGFSRYIWGGKSVIFKEKPTLLNADIEIDLYENIFIGTPIWAGTYAAPINTLIHSNLISNKNLAFFACHGGGGAKKCMDNFKKALPNNNYIGEIELLDPLKNNTDENILKVKEWVKGLKIN